MEISRLSRLAAILIHLQSKRLLTAKHIADKFDISIRTVYRDIRALEQAGVPIVTEEGKGYRLLDGYRLPPVMFTEEEANALITGAKIISRNKDRSLVENYNAAITKIKAILKYDDRDKADLLANRLAFLQNFPQTTTSNYLSTIQISITHFKLIKIRYESLSKKEMTNRMIEPQALYHAHENWIVIGWCHLRNAYREFRLDQIQTIELLDEQFTPRAFDLMAYFTKTLKS